MPAKKSKSRTPKKTQQMTKANQLTVVIICALFVIVGVFLVYKSFAASIGGF